METKPTATAKLHKVECTQKCDALQASIDVLRRIERLTHETPAVRAEIAQMLAELQRIDRHGWPEKEKSRLLFVRLYALAEALKRLTTATEDTWPELRDWFRRHFPPDWLP
jgi:hypothetical protein